MKANHRYAHCILLFSRRLRSEEITVLLSVAGIRERKTKGTRTALHCPYHAIEVAQHIITTLQLPLAGAQWLIATKTSKTWESYVELYSKQGEVQPWVLDNFLLPYQIAAIVETGHKVGSHLWHPTGAGKTLTGILWCLISPPSCPVIVVTRAAARIQYGREFGKFTNLRAHVIRPSSQKKSQTLDQYLEGCREKEQRPVIVVGWESLIHHIEPIKRLAQFGASVIFDESHRGKSPKRWQAVPLPEPSESDDPLAFKMAQESEAKRKGGFIPDKDDSRYSGTDLGRVMILPRMNVTSAASQLSKFAARVICTTATPVKDRVRDLFAQLDLAEPFSWGSANTWLFRYAAARAGKYGGLDTTGSSNQPELAMRLEKVVHRVDYHDAHRHLPEKRRQSVYIAPEDQCRASAGFAKMIRAAKRRGAGSMLEVRIMQAASKKRKAVLSMVEDHVASGHKVTLFSGRRRDVEELGESIKKLKMVKKIGTPVWIAHGGDNDKVRDQIKLDYGAHKGSCVLVATGQSFGESVDGLQCTDAAFFVSLPYTPGDIRQWEGRFARNGQTHPVVIYYMIAEDTVDEHIADILINKMDAVRTLAQDAELAEAEEVLSGGDNEEELMASILSKLED